MGASKLWTVEVLLDEDDTHTDARVVLNAGDSECVGWGRARRNPGDPNIPRIGEELAVARALNDLSHKLMEEAAHIIEVREQHPVHLHR